MRIVLDTNILIPALIFPGSKPDQILSQIRRGEIDFYPSPFMLTELDRVLRGKLHLGKSEADAPVRAIRTVAHMVQPTERITVITIKDDDNRILECAFAAQAEFLVTGDKAHLLPLESYLETRIITPAQFLDLYGPAEPSGNSTPPRRP